MSTHPGQILRQRLAAGPVIAPGAFNALVARAIAQTGFDACYISGGATANVAGYPDIGLITLTEMCRTIREISDAGRLPVIADADTGYGEGESMTRTTIEYERSGAAAMHIEDQVFPKRCGHLDGKELISTDHMVEKIEMSVEHRLSDHFMVIARTDARSVNGIEDTIDRANRYRAAGADMIFPEGLHTEDEFALVARESPGLLLANMTEFGKTPHITTARFGELGYDLVIYPLTMMRLAMGHVMHGLRQLREKGTAEGLIDQMQTRAELYDLLDYEPGLSWPFQAAETDAGDA